MTGKRLITLGVMLGIVWMVSILRVFQIQVLKSSYYGDLAKDQSEVRVVLAPKRGEIFDQKGVRLIANVDQGAGMPAGFRGSRICPNGRMAGQLLGVVSHDGYGQSGLELHLDRDLRGTDGWRYVRHDARNRYTPGDDEQASPPVNGVGVRLTLDARLQDVVEHALERGVKRTGAKQGVVIVVEPATGDILAMANYPFFDPNARDSAAGESWKNRAVSMVYEPGSAFKVVTAAALLQEGRMAPSDTVDAEGGTYKLAGQVIHDTHSLRRISFTDALAFSSNIAFAKMSMRMRPIDFYKYIRSFGFGMKTSVTLPAEESGRIQAVANWSARSEPTIAFGHEISVTPLQMVMAFAAVANNGILMRPRLVRAWVDGEGHLTREEPPRQIRRVIADSSAATLREMMRGATEFGTAADIHHPSITIAGKTGTAEKIDPKTGKYMHGHFHSSFIGMAPAEHPAFVCLVMLDEPTQLKYGGQSAAPIFREVLDRVVSEGMITPDHPEVWAAKSSLPPIPGTSQLAKEFPAQVAGLVNHAAPSKVSVPMSQTVNSTAASPHAEQGSLSQSRSNAGSDHVMPNLHNTTLRDALQRLQELGVQVEFEGAGKVLEQEPLPGSALHRGIKCRLKLGWAG